MRAIHTFISSTYRLWKDHVLQPLRLHAEAASIHAIPHGSIRYLWWNASIEVGYQRRCTSIVVPTPAEATSCVESGMLLDCTLD